MKDNDPYFNLERIMARFYSKINKTPSCWLWTGGLIKGYGDFYYGKHAIKAHRLSFIISKGNIPDGLVIDHTCRVKNCVNPKHLRAVTAKVNALENSDSASAINIKKTHCIRGHALIGKNIISSEYARVGRRQCRECYLKRQKDFYYKNKTKSVKVTIEAIE